MQILWAVITSPIAGRKKRCRALNAQGTRACHKTHANTMAVTPLRQLTAVSTSTPLLKAKRAATWLAPIISAISSKVAKAAPESALALARMGKPGGPGNCALEPGCSQDGQGPWPSHAGLDGWHLSSPCPTVGAVQFGL